MTTKKATKKSTTKGVKKSAQSTKKSTKKSSTKKKTVIRKKRVVGKVDPDKYFVLYNGVRLENYLVLAQVMDELDEETFRHHVNPEKNDFATWVQDAFDEPELAARLRGVMSPLEVRLTIYKYLVEKYLE